MSIKRIIGCLLVRRGIVVQSLGFERYLPVGRPEISARFFDEWGVDETMLLDIEASRQGRLIDLGLVGRVSNASFAPVAVGGGIRGTDDIRAVLEAGADKICVNRLAADDLDMISEASRLFGAQCIIASVDVRKTDGGDYKVFTDGGGNDLDVHPAQYAKRLADAGAGEILLTSIDRDGTRQGYDLDLIEQVAPEVEIPVIVCGGAGHPDHMKAALALESVSAVAAANFLHHSEHSISVLKSWLRNEDANVRGEHHALYRNFTFSDDARVLKLSDADLSEQVFEFVEDDLA
ncbi:MAG: imidazole glycerol phosphate synthase subunit HisF [Rhodospirillales bacterium]|nr:imidazole glycerol phosphate synthase subunit HisF [Rhodospirillales bacterium]